MRRWIMASVIAALSGPAAGDAADLTFADEAIMLSGWIEAGDRDTLHALLKQHPETKKVVLTSDGGSLSEATDLADLIIDYELDTHVVGECSSACASYVQLAGAVRTMERGSKIGYHKSSWSYKGIKEEFDAEKERYDNDPFKFAIRIDHWAQELVFSDLEYFLERRVSAKFAIKTLQADSRDMWYPRRKELLKAGVLTD